MSSLRRNVKCRTRGNVLKLGQLQGYWTGLTLVKCSQGVVEPVAPRTCNKGATLGKFWNNLASFPVESESGHLGQNPGSAPAHRILKPTFLMGLHPLLVWSEWLVVINSKLVSGHTMQQHACSENSPSIALSMFGTG